MIQLFSLVVAAIAGMGLGLFYFGGLWLTLRRLPNWRKPTLLLISSYLGRTIVVLAGFYFVMGGRWERALACLVGFITIRFLLIFRLRPDRWAVASSGDEGL